MSSQDTDDFSCINNKYLTTSYKYPSSDQEFIFACKGRPFAAMVYSYFPSPTSNLLDYDLVQKLGLKITDIQCKKFHFHHLYSCSTTLRPQKMQQKKLRKRVLTLSFWQAVSIFKEWLVDCISSYRSLQNNPLCGFGLEFII